MTSELRGKLAFETFNFFPKRIDVLKAAVHRSEANIRYLIEHPQRFHDLLTDDPGTYFPFSGSDEAMLDITKRGFHFVAGDWPFFQRAQHPGAYFLFIERYSRAISFHDPRQRQLSSFVSGKALFAGQALASAANLVTTTD